MVQANEWVAGGNQVTDGVQCLYALQLAIHKGIALRYFSNLTK
jgi:hypothetical protein